MKIDKNGFEYFDKLPEGYRLATLDDFHKNGRKILGKEYLIQWARNNQYYEIRHITEKLTGDWLMPFIKENRVFIHE
ncbi:MAG: hypothetical protein ACOYM0_01210 [Bacteroidales bacterium]